MCISIGTMTKTPILEHEVFAVSPRLSDEELDTMERDDSKDASLSIIMIEGWNPWDPEDIADIRKIIARLEPKQQFILEAYLDGLTFSDVSVTEKYWRYHFARGLEIIKKELGL